MNLVHISYTAYARIHIHIYCMHISYMYIYMQLCHNIYIYIIFIYHSSILIMFSCHLHRKSPRTWVSHPSLPWDQRPATRVENEPHNKMIGSLDVFLQFFSSCFKLLTKVAELPLFFRIEIKDLEKTTRFGCKGAVFSNTLCPQKTIVASMVLEQET